MCQKCPLYIQGVPFEVSLFVLPNCEFDLILGMDWLSKHEAWIDCQERRLYLRGLGKESILLMDQRPTSIFARMAFDMCLFVLLLYHVLVSCNDLLVEFLCVLLLN